MSGPLLDRIDLQVGVPAVDWGELSGDRTGPSTAEVRSAVREARGRATRRLAGDDGADRAVVGRVDGRGAVEAGGRRRSNADMSAGEVRRHCSLGPKGEALVRRGVEEHGLSARGYGRLLKVARTVADLEGEEEIGPGHVAEALQYRLPGRCGR